MQQPNGITVLDGSFTFQLMKHTDKMSDGDPLWSARCLYTDPDAVMNTHLDYLRAGSNVIETNTYQASVEGFIKYLNLSEEDSYNLIKKAVDIAKSAREKFLAENYVKRTPLIAGSIGPYGAYLHDLSEYSGSYVNTTSRDTIKKFHASRLRSLVEGGVDILAFETIPCKQEAEILLELLKDYPNMKAWLTFTAHDENSIAKGDNFQETAKYCYKLNPEQILAVGINCTNLTYIEPLFKDFNMGETKHIPLIVYPNSGETFEVGKGWIGKEKCQPIESYVETWLDLGITWIGGCCRVCATDISKIAAAVKKWEEKSKI